MPTALPFLVLVPFACAGVVRRRHDPALTLCLLWQLGYGYCEGGYDVAVLIVVAITVAQELADRRLPAPAPADR
ncbi:hypothetical protein [Streptomyces sp. NPDC006463]|uniref:hypothetical protein n=1 Tax=Streptomyces sp. NPDC006463 TaxID=3364746 RepID=UPI0036BEA538